jgi:hypothetical protein
VKTLSFAVSLEQGTVSAILNMPAGSRCVLLLGHGAGAGMRHPFLESMAKCLGEHGIATLRYQFPYMERKQKRPDPTPILLATVQSAFTVMRDHARGLPLFAGGKSMGGRMTSMAAAEGLLPNIHGIVFFGFPLHPPNQPEKWKERAEHLKHVQVPMLFLQGTRDVFARVDLLQPVCTKLGKLATLHLVEGGDHSFKVQQANSDVLRELAKRVADWMEEIKQG